LIRAYAFIWLTTQVLSANQALDVLSTSSVSKLFKLQVDALDATSEAEGGADDSGEVLELVRAQLSLYSKLAAQYNVNRKLAATGSVSAASSFLGALEALLTHKDLQVSADFSDDDFKADPPTPKRLQALLPNPHVLNKPKPIYCLPVTDRKDSLTNVTV
jgi:hypothetical protein